MESKCFLEIPSAPADLSKLSSAYYILLASADLSKLCSAYYFPLASADLSKLSLAYANLTSSSIENVR